MNSSARMRRRSTPMDVRPAVLWFAVTTMLLSVMCAGMLLVRFAAGDWLELKMESARVRVLELLPKPAAPEYVPTPFARNANAPARPTIVWSAMLETRSAETQALPVETLAPTEIARVEPTQVAEVAATIAPAVHPTRTPLPAQPVGFRPIQPSVELGGITHEAQRFNNCGPTTLRMYLSFYDYRQDTQVEIANVLKPNKDDRNVSPNELIRYARRKGFHALTRVNGDLAKLKLLLSNNIPVVIEEGYDPPRAKQGWMGHYLLINGYDESGILAQDSYNGPNQRVTWQELDDHWRDFNRTYLLVYTDEQADVVNAIVGEDLDDATMYAKAAQRAQEEWNANPDDPFAAFNLGSSLVGLGEYEAAAQAFDAARVLKLPWRMLWYQFGPYEAYYQIGHYEEVIALADATLKPTGDLEESYYYQGLALEKLGRLDAARAAFEQALKYNANYDAARQALDAL